MRSKIVPRMTMNLKLGSLRFFSLRLGVVRVYSKRALVVLCPPCCCLLVNHKRHPRPILHRHHHTSTTPARVVPPLVIDVTRTPSYSILFTLSLGVVFPLRLTLDVA